jgi:hypothetical protein
MAPRISLSIVAIITLVATTVTGSGQRSSGTVGALTVPISFTDARPAISNNSNALPAALKGKDERDLEAAWPAWVTQHNAEIRARLQRGDEDSLVNFWLYGTSFTKLPRAADRDVARLGSRDKIAELLEGRLDDLINGMVTPRGNERLRHARRVIEGHGINLATRAGQDQARAFLIDVRSRVIAENERYKSAAQSAAALNDDAQKLTAYSTLFSERGLSSDTSLRPGFAIETALSTIKTAGALREVRRVGIIGPGLDFSDKAEGYDFYPLQTIQPFGIIDSLVRLDFARVEDLETITFDLSPRVNQHLESAGRAARLGKPYILQLPLDMKDPAHDWSTDLINYWRRFGDRIGMTVPHLPAPSTVAGVQVRAISVRANVVAALQPRDVNIVLERTDDEPFDLVVATNILVYYDAFEQSLALTNIAKMLRPGGFLLTNYAVPRIRRWSRAGR